MLQLVDGKIIEPFVSFQNCVTTTTTTGGNGIPPTTTNNSFDFYGSGSGSYFLGAPYVWVNSFPVYICSDKTRKAIEVVKVMHTEKQMAAMSASKFMELVEKISAIL